MVTEKIDSMNYEMDVKELREICGALQRNDDKMQNDLYYLNDLTKEGGKLDIQMKLISQNHDELVKNSDEQERENERRFGESNQRIS